MAAMVDGMNTSTIVSTPKGVNLAMLLDFLLQKTYHDLTILSELLPRKSDIERKIEIIKFASKARQQFIQVLALVKWAASAEKVDKCQAISCMLDQRNAYFVDTADSLARMARETFVQARLPNFSLPTAVDVLTTGTFNRLPQCIRTRIIPSEPVSKEEKCRTLVQLNEVIQHRLCTSQISPRFTRIQVGDGRVKFEVENEFKVTMTVKGNDAEIPWTLLNIQFLMEDKQLGDGKELVHSMQVHYIHQIVQSRLASEEKPLVDLYTVLHYFCLSLQLEIFHTQTQRYIAERWADHVRVNEYQPSNKLVISYCRSSQQKQNASFPQLTIQMPQNDERQYLVLTHSPQLQDATNAVAGKQIPTDCCSVEEIFADIMRAFTVHKLKDLHKCLADEDLYFLRCASLQEATPCLEVEPYSDCTENQIVVIYMNAKTGKLNVQQKEHQPDVKHLQTSLTIDLKKFISDFHKYRCLLYLEQCQNSALNLPVLVHRHLPIKNPHMIAHLPALKLFFQFKHHKSYALVLALHIDDLSQLKRLIETFYILQLLTTEEESSHTIVNCFQIKSEMFSKHKNVSPQKRRMPSDFLNASKRLMTTHSSFVERKEYSTINKTINSVISTSLMRIPFVTLSEELSSVKITFDGISADAKLQIVDFPQPDLCSAADTECFKENLVSCIVTFDQKSLQWRVSYNFSIVDDIHNTTAEHVEFLYNMSSAASGVLGNQILGDFRSMVKVHQHAQYIQDIIESLQDVCGIEDYFSWSYNLKRLLISYSPNRSFNIEVLFDRDTCKYVLEFVNNGFARETCPHYLTRDQLVHEFNKHNDLQYILKIVHDTYIPLSSIANIPILPAIGISSRVLSVVNNFSFIAHSSTHMKLIYRNQYILDVYFLQDSVLIRDGTLYRTDSTKAMRGFSTIVQLASFLQLFMEKGQMNTHMHLGTDYPFTPGGQDFDQQNEHFGPASHDSSGSYKDRSMKSPAISSPCNQVSTQSPGNPYSAPSPGTFIQPSPANIAAMSPSTWPGSPPLVQGSPRPRKPISRHLLTSINVSHAPVPVVLTHSGFKQLLSPVEHGTLYAAKKGPRLCSLERFFGSILLRSHLIRVMRIDDTLKLEKFENGIVVFSGSGKNGPDTGLQYSVRLNPQTMDSLQLKTTPNKGHENVWTLGDLKILEQFFEYKVVCSPYKVCVLTALARILGTQPKIMKDFIRIMELELKTNWNGFLFKVEWCLTVPPGNVPSLALPGTPAVVLKNKNLIYLKLTEVKNENNSVTVTIVHDLKTNIVENYEFQKHENLPQEPVTWAVRARACLHNLLQKISSHISKKDCPIFCAVYTVLINMQVK